ncbi:MAG: acylphosphatase [Gemmatimonadaceae bacterium]|nr:acylphosphatase [Gemmatimonadaceae bacterium]
MADVHLQVSGKVQGVGFRWFVRMAGRRLQLAGWVRNMSDGTVEIAASGSEEKLDELRRVLRKGPDGAVVTEVTDLDLVGEVLEFPFAMRK